MVEPEGRDWRTSQSPARSPDTFSLEYDSATLVYHVATGAVHRLDPVGSVVWRFLDGATPIDELVQDLSTVFGADPEVVQADVNVLLGRLEESFLLADGPAPEPRAKPVLLTNPPSP